METLISSFSIQKEGNAPYENEDTFFPLKQTIEGTQLSFALADGATEGYYSKKWANILVRVFVRNKIQSTSININGILYKSIQNWDNWLRWYLANREKKNRPIHWFEEAALKKGAFSTLLGLILYEVDNRTGYWVSYAIGDSCIFHVRKNKLLSSFPIKESKIMNNRPTLLASNPQYNDDPLANVNSIKRKYRVGDHFYLMTDALAHWFLIEYESALTPWKTLEGFTSNKDKFFKEWIADIREKNKIRNDDVTLLHIRIKKQGDIT